MTPQSKGNSSKCDIQGRTSQWHPRIIFRYHPSFSIVQDCSHPGRNDAYICLCEYGTCQTGGLLGHLVVLIVVCWLYITIVCNKLVVCYHNAGYTFGTVQASDATPAVRACDGDLGTCSAKCATTHWQCASDTGATAQCAKWLLCACFFFGSIDLW